jgi:hypothetical protein
MKVADYASIFFYIDGALRQSIVGADSAPFSAEPHGYVHLPGRGFYY